MEQIFRRCTVFRGYGKQRCKSRVLFCDCGRGIRCNQCQFVCRICGLAVRQYLLKCTNSFQISMLSTSQTVQTLTSLNQTGSYMIIVSPTVTGNATATFMISKSAAAQSSGNVFRLTSSAGTLGTGPTYEELGVLWPATTQPQVYHATAGSQSSTTVTYNVRVVAN